MVVKFLDETCPVPTLILTLDSLVKTKIKFALKIFNDILVSPPQKIIKYFASLSFGKLDI